ncbi:MAG TPA: hypothetical protein VMB34_08310 [Acetobacteraceae bacterium]|nr:hypothetical protein [Acetobacteraceae bacterium]
MPLSLRRRQGAAPNQRAERSDNHAVVTRRRLMPACQNARWCLLSTRMIGQNRIVMLVLGICAVLVIVGFVFSVRVEQGITKAAHVEATQQSPVPTPTALAPAAHKPS